MKAEDQLYVIQELIVSKGMSIDGGIADACKRSWVYKLKDFDQTILEENTLEKLIEAGARYFDIQV